MESIGRELIATGKQDILHHNKTDRNSLKNKDLLTVLLRANMATDIPDNQRMSDSEILARKRAFINRFNRTYFLNLVHRDSYLPVGWP
jgi:hypothetical protein